MKDRFLNFIATYVLVVCLFVLQKPLFMGVYYALYADISWADWFRVMWHGLPLDLSLAGYVTVIPGLLLIASLWTSSRILHYIRCGYFALVSVFMSLVAVTDLSLYGFWGFRLDATPLFYFFSSPKDAVAGVSTWAVVGGVLLVLLYAVLIYTVFHFVLLRKTAFPPLQLLGRKVAYSAVLLFCTALLFIPIRGGFTVSTMNTGQVYFSSDQKLNHAAINPIFSLMESLSKQKDFGGQYRFMPPEEADRLFDAMLDPEVAGWPSDSVRRDSSAVFLKTQRPDVLMVILESFSSHLMTALGGEPDIAVCLDSLAEESVLFTNMYANSFRTDRGLVSILSGYPAQPTTSIMKYPRNTQSLPSIAGSLRKVGYGAKYYYGGDADFTNMRSYLMASGFESIVADKDFPLSERLSKWGVHDHFVFARLLDDLKAESAAGKEKSMFRVLQTSSSHEPFEVPYRRLADNRLNAFAYTDSCVGDFIRRFREMPQWDNTLVLLVPDHLGAYPDNIDHLSFECYRIPLLMLGGAVLQPRRIDVCGSQQDIAATLLAQMGLPHGDFTFSKDMMNPVAPHFAFFTFPDAFGLLMPDSRVVHDNQAGRVVSEEGETATETLEMGKAYLQKLYDDMAGR